VRNDFSVLIDTILQLDSAIQHQLRINWPETWLRISLPLGSTRALLAIEIYNARTPGRVAEVLGISRTTVTGLLDRLESAGLLTRAIDPDDRRSFVLQLTEQGRGLIREIEGDRREQLARALATMDEASLTALSSGLQALTAAIREVKTPSKEETCRIPEPNKTATSGSLSR
jgi:DNA-binding MarR family transcriptional regulator